MEFVSNTQMRHSIRVSLRNIHTHLLLLCSRERKQSCIKLHLSKGFSFNMTFKQLLPNMQNVTKETRNCGKSQHLLFVPSKGSKNPLKQYFKYLYSALGPAFLLHSGNRFGSTFDFCLCFFFWRTLEPMDMPFQTPGLGLGAATASVAVSSITSNPPCSAWIWFIHTCQFLPGTNKFHTLFSIAGLVWHLILPDHSLSWRDKLAECCSSSNPSSGILFAPNKTDRYLAKLH